jgi:steroid delta-isomerase-like uncharacterized protein
MDPATPTSASPAPQAGDLKALAQRFADEVINAQDLGVALAELVAEDFVEQNPLPGQGPGRSGLGDVLAGMFAAFPDLRWTPQEMIAEGDRVMSFSIWTGTHRGAFMGIPPTGRQVNVEAWTLDRFDGGRMVQSRIIMDVAGPLAQLGALPMPAGT